MCSKKSDIFFTTCWLANEVRLSDLSHQDLSHAIESVSLCDSEIHDIMLYASNPIAAFDSIGMQINLANGVRGRRGFVSGSTFSYEVAQTSVTGLDIFSCIRASDLQQLGKASCFE